MDLTAHPREIALNLLKRSTCAVQVAAVLVDAWGVHAWGWNSSGPSGMGQHAEAHALSRANKARLAGSTLYVVAQRTRANGRVTIVTARPCHQCQHLMREVRAVIYRDGLGKWKGLHHDD